MPRTSPERAAVRIANASAFAAMPSAHCQFGHERGACRQSSAGWCSTRFTLARLRQQVVEMAAPARRVVACASADRRRVVQHRLDPLPHPARGLRFVGPDPSQARQSRRPCRPPSRRGRRSSDRRRSPGSAPLLGVLGVAPARALALDQLLGGGLERQCILAAALRHWVQPVDLHDAAGRPGPVSRALARVTSG